MTIQTYHQFVDNFEKIKNQFEIDREVKLRQTIESELKNETDCMLIIYDIITDYSDDFSKFTMDGGITQTKGLHPKTWLIFEEIDGKIVTKKDEGTMSFTNRNYILQVKKYKNGEFFFSIQIEFDSRINGEMMKSIRSRIQNEYPKCEIYISELYKEIILTFPYGSI